MKKGIEVRRSGACAVKLGAGWDSPSSEVRERRALHARGWERRVARAVPWLVYDESLPAWFGPCFIPWDLAKAAPESKASALVCPWKASRSSAKVALLPATGSLRSKVLNGGYAVPRILRALDPSCGDSAGVGSQGGWGFSTARSHCLSHSCLSPSPPPPRPAGEETEHHIQPQ